MEKAVGSFVISALISVTIFEKALSVYVPNEIDQTPRPYTTGIKIKSSHYKTYSQPIYHVNYSKVYVHNKNYTSSLFDGSDGDVTNSQGRITKLYPVYDSSKNKEKLKDILKEHNTNVVEKDTMNNRIVYKRRIEKHKNIEVHNKCPKGLTGQFVYDLACNQFLDCWKGRGGPRNCAPGTLFNPKTLECDFPEKVECLTGPTGSVAVQKTAKYQNFEQAKCPQGFSGLIPNYTDCSKFLQCNDGIQTRRDCPPGTLFDTKLNVCNFPKQTTCFSGEQPSNYVVNKEIGGSTDGGWQYQGQTGNYRGQTGRYYGQNYNIGLRQEGQNVHRYSQDSGGSTTSGARIAPSYDQNVNYYNTGFQTAACNPQNQNCGSNQYGTDQNHGGTGTVQQDCNPNIQDCSQYYAQGTTCDPQKQNCGQSSVISHGRTNVRQGEQTSGTAGGTVYIQYALCHPNLQDCSKFQQNTFIPETGSPLCDPQKQGCNQGGASTIVREKTDNSGVTYYVKYVACNPGEQDCSPYQKGTVVAAYGGPDFISGSTQGQGSVQSTTYCDPQKQNCGQSTVNVQVPSECNPQYHNCDTVSYQNQNKPHISSYPQISGTFATQSPSIICNPQLEKCDQDVSGSTGSNVGTRVLGLGSSVYSPGGGAMQKPKLCNPQFQNCFQSGSTTITRDYNSPNYSGTTNYNKICNDNDRDCYLGGRRTQGNAKQSHGTEPRCPDGFQGITKHPSDCKKFLNCANGITYVQDCAPGTLFNHLMSTCDFPYNVDCQHFDDGRGTTEEIEYATYGQGQHSGGHYNKIQGQDPQGQTNCQGYQCIQNPGYKTQSQGQFGQGYRQHKGQTSVSHAGQGQPSCQGYHCVQNQGYVPQAPDQVHRQSQQGCQGAQCAHHQGYLHQGQVQYPGQQENVYKAGQASCQGFQCTQGQGYTPSYGSGQGYIQKGQISGDHRTGENGHVIEIPPKPTGGVTPINKFDRVTSGGFNNQKSTDYVDIFDPDESRGIAFATTTRKPERPVWPPPFPDLVTTDVNADYVFEYEDGEPVTLAPEKVSVEKRKKTRCGKNDFMCTSKICVAKNFVCDGLRDCDDGKDEKYCQKYLDEFKPYKNSRLDVLEKQRWDNVSYATCALLCMDSEKFECKSFNYRKMDRVCFLTNENVGSTGALKNYYPCDYYERKGTSLDCSDTHKCPNGKCLNSDEICDGYDDCGDRFDEKGCRPEDFGYSVKLAGGEGEHEGRVEVRVFGKTGFICDDQFSITDADVLCKELGFDLGAAEVKGNSFFAKDIKENHTVYMMDDIECFGNETSIMYCNFAGWGIHNCADHEIAGVICKTPQETCSEGFWKCDTGNECVRLPFVCDGLDDCTDNSDEASHHCDSSTEYRLANGNRKNEGRLEIRHHGIWGSVCDDDFNEDAAKIVCRYLGYSGSAYVKKEAYFGQSDGPIWLDQVSCYGNESSIEKCTHWEWGDHNCDHSEDVGVICSNEIDVVEAQRSSKAVGDVGLSGSNNGLEASRTSASPTGCGYRKDNIFLESDDVHFRVVQGSIARPGEYPWQAALRIKGQEKSAHWCGAVVISSKWVLTAAHCLEGYPKGAYIVVAGEYNIDEDEGTEQQAYIEEYYLHENFRKGHKMGNDIAMIKLKGNGFKLNQDVQPICLPNENSDYDRDLNCTISGFGTIQTGKSAYSHKLRAAWIPVQKMDVCKMAHIYGEALGTGMICAGELDGGIDACDGDSGGPLACLEDGVFTLYGLTSWGQRCGYANKPGVYVKVSYYKRWIDNIMKHHP